jgi:hypothetical protein
MTERNVLPSGLSAQPSPEERLARALFSDNQFNSTGPKFSAFMPSATDKTSVFRQCDHDPALLSAACAAAASGHGKPAKRVAICTVAQVLDVKLDVVPSEPPPRHADLMGWPIHSDPERQKAERKLAAMQLAAVATVVAVP